MVSTQLLQKACLPFLFWFSAILLAETESAFEHAYQADVMPENARPRWSCVVNQNRSGRRAVLARNGVLHLITPAPRDNMFWAVGSWNSRAGDKSWRINQEIGATVDFRVRVLDGKGGAFQLQVADGKHYWSFFFSAASVVQVRQGSPASTLRPSQVPHLPVSSAKRPGRPVR